MVKNLPANAGDTGDTDLIPGSGRSPGERNGNPLWYSSLENPVDRVARWATVCGGHMNTHHILWPGCVYLGAGQGEKAKSRSSKRKFNEYVMLQSECQEMCPDMDA